MKKPPNDTLHRIAARWRFCLKPKGYGGAARGELVALALMTWGVATTHENRGEGAIQ